jgi:hypothetical protein
MHQIDARVYQLNSVKDEKTLQKRSAHSLWVDACILTHSSGMPTAEIQFLSRWRSDAIMVYTQNTAAVADRKT